MIKAIIFDLWGTLVNKFDNKGNKIKIRDIFVKLQNEMDINDPRFVEKYETATNLKEWQSEEKMFMNLFESFNIKYSKKDIKKLMNLEIESDINAVFDKNMELLIKKLRKNYKIGLISNTTQFAVGFFNKNNYDKFFDSIAFSYKLGIKKPDKRIFEKIIKDLKIKPDEAIMIGDSLRSDIHGAKSAGLNTIHFKDFNQLKKDLELLGIRF